MKKIALFIRSFQAGGAEKQSVLLAEYLGNRYDVCLLVYYPEGPYLRLAEEKKINVIPIKFSGILKVFYFIYVCTKLRPFLLISFLPINNILGGMFFRIAGIRHFIGGIRGVKIKKSKIKMSLSKYICNKRSTFFISNSEAGKKSYAAYGYNADKIIVIPNSIEINKNIKPAWNNRELTILSVGRLTSEKDYPTALDAISMLLKSDPGLKLTYHIVGYGKLHDEIKNEITEKRLEGYVTIHTGVGYSGVGAFYEKADIYLITSCFEGMPNTVMEAMDNYLPIVGTKAGDCDKLILHGKNGFLAEIGDSEHIYEYLKILAAEPHLREELGNYGKKHLVEHFSTDSIGKQYVDLIDSLS